MSEIGVVDYNAGNLKSVANALEYIGAKFYISSDPDRLIKSDKLIFPGVGHAGAAMDYLNSHGLSDMLRAFAASGKPLFGICVGSQILLDSSEEGNTACLGILKGDCRLFSLKDLKDLKVPQIGWNQVSHRGEHYLFKGVEQGSSFYFVHSYYTVPDEDANILCTTEYGITYASGLVRDNICSVQFHPERSGENGLRVLKNFTEG